MNSKHIKMAKTVLALFAIAGILGSTAQGMKCAPGVSTHGGWTCIRDPWGK
ncbi:MAG: hypothetical protein U0Z75_07570 [Deinococcaceae bacterium]